MSLTQLLQEKKKRLATIPDIYSRRFTKAEADIINQLIKELTALDNRNGKILMTRANIQKIPAIIEKIKLLTYSSESEYIQTVKEFLEEFNRQAQVNVRILSSIYKNFQPSEVLNDLRASYIKNVAMLFETGHFERAFAQPIADTLLASITRQMTLNELSDLLISKTGNLLAQHAKIITRDSIAIFDRQFTISASPQAEFYIYLGSRVADTRCFCALRKGKVFHRKEIESWGDKPSLWENCAGKGLRGGGRHPNTNRKTIFVYLGGYGCVDSLLPTVDVPAEAIQRAKDLGFL